MPSLLATAAATVVIIAGQSNNLVYKTVPAEIPARIRPDPRVQIWNARAGWFEMMVPGENTHAGIRTSAGSFGPEVEFADEWRKDHPGETLYIIKDRVVEGQTGLAQDPNAWDWSPQSRGEQYDKATASITAARAQLSEVGRVIVLLEQGETDAADPAKDAAFAGNERDFLEHMRADWGAQRILIARIPRPWGADSNVRRVQTALGAFDTDGFALAADNGHFSGAGAIALGAGFYAAFKAPAAQADAKTPVPGPGNAELAKGPLSPSGPTP